MRPVSSETTGTVLPRTFFSTHPLAKRIYFDGRWYTSLGLVPLSPNGGTMPTRKPRLQITLSPELYETIQRFAAYERRPMAKVIMDLLEQIGPMLQSTVAALDQVQRSKGGPAAALALAVTRMQGAVEQLAEKATGQLDLLRAEAGPAPARVPAQQAPPGRPRKRPKKLVKGRKRRGAT